jgi:hypothetical protein
MNTASLKSALGSYSQGFVKRPNASTENVNFHSEMIQKVAGVVEEAATKEAATRANKGLSDEGKATTIATGATATAAKLAFLERVVSRVEGERQTAKATLDLVKPPSTLGPDPLLRYLFAKEIRDRYTGLDQQKRDAAYLQAAAEDHETVLWAIQETPAGPMITPEIRQRGLDERGQRVNPELYNSWRQSDLLHDSLNGLRNGLVNWLTELGGDPQAIYKEMGGPLPEPTASYVLVKQG